MVDQRHGATRIHSKSESGDLGESRLDNHIRFRTTIGYFHPILLGRSSAHGPVLSRTSVHISVSRGEDAQTLHTGFMSSILAFLYLAIHRSSDAD